MYKIGADVYTTDGRAGMLMKVVFNRETGCATHLIVDRGFLKKSDRVVPLRAVAQATPYRIRLNVSAAELEQLPRHGEDNFISEGMLVCDRADHVIGTVQLVYPGGASDEAVERARRRLEAVTSAAEAPQGTVAGDHVPPELLARMLRQGYIRIQGPGIMGLKSYVTPEQIAGVVRNRVQLYASRDELIAPGTAEPVPAGHSPIMQRAGDWLTGLHWSAARDQIGSVLQHILDASLPKLRDGASKADGGAHMFKIGADVYTTDGKAGKLMKVVIDPESERVTHLIVEKGFLSKIDRVVPLEAIAETGDDGIRLGVSTAELEELPQFNETEFRVPDPGWERESYQVDDPAHVLRWGIHYASPQVDEYVNTRDEEITEGVDADRPVIGRGCPVYDREGQVGEVDGLHMDETTGKITHVVVKQGLLGGQLVIPMSAVSSIGDTSINVDLTREQLVALSSGGQDTG